MTQQREEREKTNHPKQLSCTVQPQGEGWEGAQGHLEQAQSWANEFPPLEMLSCIDTREERCFLFISLWYGNFYMTFGFNARSSFCEGRYTYVWYLKNKEEPKAQDVEPQSEPGA